MNKHSFIFYRKVLLIAIIFFSFKYSYCQEKEVFRQWPGVIRNDLNDHYIDQKIYVDPEYILSKLNSISKYYFIENVNLCIDSIKTAYQNLKNFKENADEGDYVRSYKFLQADNLVSDSLIVAISEKKVVDPYPEYIVQDIDIRRYFSDIRKVNKSFNTLLNELLNLELLQRFPINNMSDTSGFIFGGPLDIILTTGFAFKFDNVKDDWIVISIEYQYDYNNNWNLKNEFVLNLTLSRKTRKCQ